MSHFPDWIYKFTPRDEQVTPLELYDSGTDVVVFGASYQTTLGTVPKGRILLLDNINVQLTSGAAVVPLAYILHTVNAIPFGSSIVGCQAPTTETSAGVPWFNNKNTSGTIIEPDKTLYITTFFSGAAANRTEVKIRGVMIPRGNFAV